MIKGTKFLLTKLIILTFLIPFSVSAETPVGSTIESRATLAFKVNDQAAQAMLPEGWKLLTLPKGPLAGANLLVAFIDKYLARDAQGKPLTPYSSRTVAIVNYGVKADVKGPRMFITRVFETPPVVNPYGNSVAASISRSASLDGPADGEKTHKEKWSVKAKSGGEINLSLSYKPGKPRWKSSKATPYSTVNPDFYRIYKYEQLADLAMSKAIGRDLNGVVSFQSTIPELVGVFDKNEKLVGVIAIPVYVREISLP